MLFDGADREHRDGSLWIEACEIDRRQIAPPAGFGNHG
jgi:hypothetical protein